MRFFQTFLKTSFTVNCYILIVKRRKQMKNFTLKRASEVEEIYDIRTKYYFIGWIDLQPV